MTRRCSQRSGYTPKHIFFSFRKVAFFQKILVNWPPLQATVLGARRKFIREPAEALALGNLVLVEGVRQKIS